MKRVFAVVLHGLGRYYLDPLLARGRLPNVRRLIEEGAAGELLAPFPISAATWATIHTGQTAGVHGALDYIQVDARSYHGTRAEIADVAQFRDDTVYSVLSRAGGRVAALFMPMTYPPWELDGVMISGFPIPDERLPPSHPPELAERLGPVTSRRLLSLRYEHKDDVEQYLIDAQARIEEITLSLWENDDFDLMCTCIASPDLAHHYFWSRDDPQAQERLDRVYERVDATVGRYREQVGDDAYFLVYSDHGGGPAPHRRFNVNRWLIEGGWLRQRSALVDRLGIAKATNFAVEQLRRFRVHQMLRGVLRGPVRQGVLSLTRNDAFLDWSRSRAYGIDFFYPLVGVEVNLRGRQAHGVVEPGREYEKLRAQLRDELVALVAPETGARVCRAVHYREEMFHGPHLGLFPDVIAELAPDYDGRIQLDAEVFADNDGRWDYPFMGYHAREAFLAAVGPDIPAGKRLEPADMLDLAPTLLDLAGVSVPDSMEGRPLPLR